MSKKDKKKGSVNTDGGAYIGGSVNTGGGDFVGRDKKVKVEKGVYIGGDAKDNTIIVGDDNIVGGATQNIFAPIYQAIQNTPLAPQDKGDLKAEVEEIETEIVKADAEIDESALSRHLRNIQRIAPDILDVVLATMANPAAGFGMVAKKVAGKMQADAG